MYRFALTLLALVSLAGCSKLTAANYQRLHVGMSFGEVSGLIGAPAVCNETLGLRSCTWGDESRKVHVNFVAGAAVVFSAHNLK